MKNLWTPWRMPYVLGQEKKPNGCIFEAAKDKLFDQKSLILFRDNTTVVLMNRYPYSNGHLLIAPVRHLADLADLAENEAGQLMSMIRKSTAILRSNLQPDGFNIGLNLGESAGAGLADHLHFHVVPRWDGDHNFMTSVAAIRTIPEHIDLTFARLLDDFQNLNKSKEK